MSIKKLTSVMAVAVSAIMLLVSCGANTPKTTPSPAPTSAPTAKAETKSLEELTQNKDNITITVHVNNEDKEIKAELYPDLAPETVKNFEKLIGESFYDGLIFHRVISGFMIQGGGYDDKMQEKDAETIHGEFDANGFDNPLKHTRGVLSMARTSVPDSASSQFFIMHEDYPSLDGQYAAFGKVTSGIEVVDEIASSETGTFGGMDDVPSTPIIIKSIKMDN